MNYQQLMRQAQEMQKKMLKMQEELAQKQFEAVSGGGLVTALVNGQGQLLSLKIKPEAIDPNDAGMLEDLVVVAVNEALKKISEDTSHTPQNDLAGMAKKMGIKIPGF